MKILVINRGAPGCGKTTFLKNNGLDKYAISTDDIRLLYRSPMINIEGKEIIAQLDNKHVFNLLFEILETRMQRGEFVIVDATNSTLKEINRYKKLAEKHRYRMFVNDFTSISIEECKRRNNTRPEYRRVDNIVIEKFYDRFKTPLPSAIKCIPYTELLETIKWKAYDYTDEYETIHVIGDVHGCYTALKEYMGTFLPSNHLYIFTGDYIDRGIENKETLKYLFAIMDLPNVIFLEGNHEIHLWNYANDLKINSPEFINNTIPQIKDIDKSKIRSFYRKLRQLSYFRYHNHVFLITHGGLSTAENLVTISSRQIIKGVGTYEDSDKVDESFCKNTPDNYIQIHGHRNILNSPIHNTKRTYNIEGGVEFGGNLRVVEINKNEIKCHEIQNNVFRKDAYHPLTREFMSIEEFVKALRQDSGIDERKFNNISSFTFSRDTWKDRNWNPLTTAARGLFINTHSNKIVSRSYDKFFNIDEMPNTSIEILSRNLTYPVKCYEKYNGYLGIIGVDENELIFSSKNTLDSDYAKNFKSSFEELYPNIDLQKLKTLLIDKNISLVFEVILPDFDPHIIEYDEPCIILLDAVKREINFKKLSYEELNEIANEFNFEIKQLHFDVQSPLELQAIHHLMNSENYKVDGRRIEGLVIEDADGRAVKTKSKYYRDWKRLRSLKESLKHFDDMNINNLKDFERSFIKFLLDDKNRLEKDIITLRKEYLLKTKI